MSGGTVGLSDAAAQAAATAGEDSDSIAASPATPLPSPLDASAEVHSCSWSSRQKYAVNDISMQEAVLDRAKLMFRSTSQSWIGQL